MRIEVIISALMFASMLTAVYSFPLIDNIEQSDKALLNRQPRRANLGGIALVRKLFALKRAGKFFECRKACDDAVDEERARFESVPLLRRAYPGGRNFEPKRVSCYRMCPGKHSCYKSIIFIVDQNLLCN